MKARKKPLVVEVWRWSGTTDWSVAPPWVVYAVIHWSPVKLPIKTPEGLIFASPGDWIIQGVQGEVYPCKPDVFEKTYEVVG